MTIFRHHLRFGLGRLLEFGGNLATIQGLTWLSWNSARISGSCGTMVPKTEKAQSPSMSSMTIERRVMPTASLHTTPTMYVDTSMSSETLWATAAAAAGRKPPEMQTAIHFEGPFSRSNDGSFSACLDVQLASSFASEATKTPGPTIE